MDEVNDIADQVINALDDKVELPKPHQAAMLVVSVVAGFLAKDATKKIYKSAYALYQAKKA